MNGCATLKIKKQEKLTAEQWIGKAETMAQSAVKKDIKHEKIQEALSELRLARYQFESNNYKSAKNYAESAYNTSLNAIEEQERIERKRVEMEKAKHLEELRQQEELKRKEIEKKKNVPKKK